MNVGERLCWKILITHQRWVTPRQCTFVVTTVKKSEPANQLIVDSLQDSSVVYMKIHPMFQYQRGLWPWIRRTCFLSVLETITSSLWWICWIKSNDQVKILTDHQFLLGFSEGQIGQVLKHCESIFSVQDVLDKVEIWDLKHAQFIVQSLSQMFGDLEDFDDWAFDDDISNELDHFATWNGEWDNLLQNDSLFEVAVENLSLWQQDISADVSNEQSGHYDLPLAALTALEDYCFSAD